MIQLSEIVLAQHRLAKVLPPTPMEWSPDLGDEVWLKLENANKTHSFKIRGALNAMLLLNETERAKGIVAASSGNHAQAVAYAARLVGASAQIIMPEHTPNRKVSGVRRYGAEPVLFGVTYDAAELEGRRREREEGLTYVSPYNDPNVVAGAGTIGLEIIEQNPEVERIIVPVSGGGLMAGVATAAKSLNPNIHVIGVNAVSAPAMYNIFYSTQKEQMWDTLAEALSGDIEQGSITIDLCKQYMDEIVLVSEEQIADAMRWMLDVQGWVIEGGGAVGIAALLHKIVPADQTTAIVVSGGNVDGETIRQVLGV